MTNTAAEFRFLFPGTVRAVGEALETVKRGAAERVSEIPFGDAVSGGPRDLREVVAEFNRVAGDVLGRVAVGGYDARKFRARDAVRSLRDAMECAAMGDMAEAVSATQDAWKAAGAARRR